MRWPALWRRPHCAEQQKQEDKTTTTDNLITVTPTPTPDHLSGGCPKEDEHSIKMHRTESFFSQIGLDIARGEKHFQNEHKNNI